MSSQHSSEIMNRRMWLFSLLWRIKMKKYLSNLEQSTRGAWQEAALVSFSKSPIRSSQLSWSRILNPRGLHRLGMHPQLLFQQPHRGFHTSLWFLGRRFRQKSSSYFWGCFSWDELGAVLGVYGNKDKELPKNSQKTP